MDKEIHTFFYNFCKDLVGEKLIKEYLNIHKIHQFDSSTPMPITLLLDKKIFHKNINETQEKKFTELPIIYYNLNKLSSIKDEITIRTLIPIGILFLNNDIHNSFHSLDFYDYLKLNLNITQFKQLHKIYGNINFSPMTLVPLKIFCKKKCPFLKDKLIIKYLHLIEMNSSQVNKETMFPLGMLLLMKKLYHLV